MFNKVLTYLLTYLPFPSQLSVKKKLYEDPFSSFLK